MQAHKVIWQEGMLLRPQHLQHNDRYYHQQLNRTRLLGSDAWGFLSLDIDLQYLNLGKLVVNQASGVLPDGSLFELTTAMAPLVLEVPANAGRQSVYLALPMTTGNQVETRTQEAPEVLARYIACDIEVADSNAGRDARCQISCARPDLRLLLGEQPGDEVYVKLKIAQVLECSAEEGLRMEPDFAPTFIYVQGSGFVSSCLKEVISLLASRGDAIAERMGGNGATAGAQIADFLMLQLINRTEPVLRHYLVQAQVRSEALFREMLSILGELATFASDSKRATQQVRYLHGDQGTSFRGLMAGLRTVLSMVFEQHALELVLQQRQYGVMVCPVADLKLLGTATFILAVAAQCDSEELRHRLPAHLKIGPVERIRELVNLHLAGIKVKPLPVAPRQIPFHSGKTYFMLELSARDIAQLEQSGGFAFHVGGEFSELELTFWAIRN
ncbi:MULTISPECIES: type VI secretion system baseplate subunit TssK [unclassified Pseudomonas]|jgi:type VI secretion system protein ImpJ|uniref:type VI secretion system baseplate subunit TssK n=1 Tax=unclassified Pseudomonas TaxID=196821 RepID=UPI000C1545F8|nr:MULTISPECIES: type VI secretion system baseplate subunit TssK [unclassified Pseudomonas]MCF5232486.1 type VI secretion system baseplate subunit TssK [Pseudomonas sp. PA-5-4H]MCF5238196.1 type VI secretion system baseplate subunit TssK [Pseudomonas sp. PA-5-4G]MCF5250083.1 type VI secretion system baseplate subunit TssK [Pseudomonas sp. PA-5-4B]MCF5254082.1 type VI secretion system baseplate subunit TssK [Pseudomonas sp. PA-5-4B]MCF5261033.1 type VI secretion system baseplate subunit TssK [P